jgi:histidinol-phosphate/aromatic aminotransferase/cobyric acid decarboxylase-like protein
VLAALPDLPRHRIEAQLVGDGAWAEIDDPNDLAAARFAFAPADRVAILDRTIGGRWGFAVSDFALMCNRHFPTEAMLAAMRHALGELLASYGSTQEVVEEKLAWFLDCEPWRIVALNGAAQAFPILGELWSGRSVAIPSPTFGEFARAFPHASTYSDSPGVDFEALQRIAGSVQTLAIVNPNNPTGTTLSSNALHELAARHPSTTILVDESFVDFSDEPSLRELAPLPNVVVLCSLGKSLGVPGVRLGYIHSHDDALLTAVRERLPIWNTSALAEYVIELLLKFRPELDESLQLTRRDRDELALALAEIDGVRRVHRSGGNFLLVELAGDAASAGRLRERLLREFAIDVKDVSTRFADDRARIRVAVRLASENRRLLDALGLAVGAEVAQEISL